MNKILNIEPYNDCDQDMAECFDKGECLGDIKSKEDSNEQQSEDGTV